LQLWQDKLQQHTKLHDHRAVTGLCGQQTGHKHTDTCRLCMT